jgi:UPF0755 protein
MKKIFIFALFLLVVAAGVGGFFWARDWKLTQFSNAPFGSAEAKSVDIPTGTGPRALSELLAHAKVVANAEHFYAFLRRERLGPRLKAGEYEFSGPLTPIQVAERIASGHVKVYRFTVPEGLRVEETLPILAQSELHLEGSKLAAVAANRDFLRKLSVPASSPEGFLFPDTYAFSRGVNEEGVLAKMVSRSLEEYRKADAQRKKGITLDLLQTMTLASIIEKETAAPEERPRISCVFHNRLRLRMRLGTDPTVLYAMWLIRGKWINNITSEDLRTEHPYNTYTSYGLPPGPIASPGSASIQAALNPIDCNDLYFVSRNNGTHVFCPDLKCHNEAVEYWQREYFRKQKHRGG